MAEELKVALANTANPRRVLRPLTLIGLGLVAAVASGCSTVESIATGTVGDNPKISGSYVPIDCNKVSYDPNIISATLQGTQLVQAEQISASISRYICPDVNEIASTMVSGYKKHTGNGYGGTFSNGQFDIESGDSGLTDVYFATSHGKPLLSKLQLVIAGEVDPNNQDLSNNASVSYDPSSRSFEMSTSSQYNDPSWPNIPVVFGPMTLPQLEHYEQVVENFEPYFAGAAAGNETSY